jgi:hypothetical protein
MLIDQRKSATYNPDFNGQSTVAIAGKRPFRQRPFITVFGFLREKSVVSLAAKFCSGTMPAGHFIDFASRFSRGIPTGDRNRAYPLS